MSANQWRSALTVIAILTTGLVSRAATSFDPATDFSATNNPNSVWSFGYSTSLSSPLVLYDVKQNIAGLDYWESSKVNQLTAPNVSHNGTSASISTGTIVVPPNGLSMHPGPNGEYTHVLFTALSAGTYSVVGSFGGEDTGGTTTDVHVLDNGASLFTGNVNGSAGTTVPFDLTNLTLAAGDTIDFAVGVGADDSYLGDTTALSATVSQTSSTGGSSASVPLPRTFWPALALLGLIGAAASRRRRPGVWRFFVARVSNP